MGKKDKIANDVASIEWVDRETVRFSCENLSALVWVDYEVGFFNNGRIIKGISIEKGLKSIDDGKKNEILNAVRKYFEHQGIRCRVEITS